MSEEDFENPDWVRGFNYGLYRGYFNGIDDFKAGLRAVWKKDNEGVYRIIEKHFHTDQDEGELRGVKAGGTEDQPQIQYTPDQIKKLNATIKGLLLQYGQKNPQDVGRFQPQAYLITPGTTTHNWGIMEKSKLLITKSQVAITDFIPDSEIMFFIDYEP